MDSYEDGSGPLGSKNGGVLRTCEQVLASSEVLLIHGVSYLSSHCVFWNVLVHILSGELPVISEISYNILCSGRC